MVSPLLLGTVLALLVRPATPRPNILFIGTSSQHLRSQECSTANTPHKSAISIFCCRLPPPGIDDLRPNLGSYPTSPSFLSPAILTPALDRLAAAGTVFDSAYCQYALCGPSRTSLLTGRRPDTTQVGWSDLSNAQWSEETSLALNSVQVVHLDSYWREQGGNFTTVPQFFRERGYTSLSVGKVFHPSAYWHPCPGCIGQHYQSAHGRKS